MRTQIGDDARRRRASATALLRAGADMYKQRPGITKEGPNHYTSERIKK